VAMERGGRSCGAEASDDWKLISDLNGGDVGDGLLHQDFGVRIGAGYRV
jgi:hypothetical protein